MNAKPIGIADGSNLSRSSLCALLTSALLTSAALICPQARASEAMPPKLYEVTTETGMPHLEDNLRYADTREKRCLSQEDLPTAFPILKHHSLEGCKLDNETRNEDTLTYLLSCEAAHGKTGTAHWQLGEDQITGRLDVRMGGKNMTFYQRVTARPVGECVSEAK
ncbi:MAG: DUF3617 domain-containing protein [Burkholderiales bacterium]